MIPFAALIVFMAEEIEEVFSASVCLSNNGNWRYTIRILSESPIDTWVYKYCHRKKYRESLLSSSPRNFNRWLVSFQSFITSKDFNFIS